MDFIFFYIKMYLYFCFVLQIYYFIFKEIFIYLKVTVIEREGRSREGEQEKGGEAEKSSTYWFSS